LCGIRGFTLSENFYCNFVFFRTLSSTFIIHLKSEIHHLFEWSHHLLLNPLSALGNFLYGSLIIVLPHFAIQLSLCDRFVKFYSDGAVRNLVLHVVQLPFFGFNFFADNRKLFSISSISVTLFAFFKVQIPVFYNTFSFNRASRSINSAVTSCEVISLVSK
jgi:hypothetical protein